MKRLALIIALLAIIGCEKRVPSSPIEGETPVFDFEFNYTPTKARKTGWEAGDVIYVFIRQVASPRYVKMRFDGSKWSAALYNGNTSVGSLGVSLNGTTIDMKAIYRPFGGEDCITLGENGAYLFNSVKDGYYMSGTKASYKVQDNKISVTFNMTLGEDFVQFFIADAAAADEGYILHTDAAAPFQLLGLNADLSVKKALPALSWGLTGYAYQGGYLFSGTFVDDYPYGTDYYFAKTNMSTYARADYLVRGKALAAKAAIILPAQDDDKWLPVGNSVTVDMGTNCGIWYTTNYNVSYPETAGDTYSYTDRNNHVDANHLVPTALQIGNLCNLPHFSMSIKGQGGNVVVAENGNFLFLPFSGNNLYWGQDIGDSSYYFSSVSGDITTGTFSRNARHLRYVKTQALQ